MREVGGTDVGLALVFDFEGDGGAGYFGDDVYFFMIFIVPVGEF